MKKMKSTRPSHYSRLFVAITSALALFPVAAIAQQAAAGDPSAQEEAARERPQDQAEDTATTLESVIVTANKRPEDIRNVASSITVIGEEQLQNINATQLSDYANYVPGLQIASDGSPGQTRASLRGIAPLSSSATVGTYIDETPVGSSSLYQESTALMLDLLPYDIDRVEILRGPQGTLYGAGAMGGLLKYVTRQPDLTETEFRVGGGVSDVHDGSHGSNFRFGANLPLSRDRLGLRVSYARNNIPGYIDNSFNGEEDINDATQTSARAALLWQGDDVSLKLTAMRQTIESDNNSIVSLDPVTGRPANGDLTHAVVVDSPFEKDIDYFAATLDWDLGWGDFTSATGYSDTDTFSRQDTTVDFGSVTALVGLPDAGSSYLDSIFNLKQFTQEFRLASKSGSAFEWLTGVFYSNEDAKNDQLVFLNQLDGNPLPPPFDDILGTLAVLSLPSDYEETAVFANVGYQFTERFKLAGGVRYARNDQDFNQFNIEGLLAEPLGESPGTSSESVFTWSLTPQFELSEDTLLYGKVATGYQAGGPNASAPGGTLPTTVDASTLTSYEMGLKTQLADNRVQIDLAVFRLDWEDIQVAAEVNGFSGLLNGGEATSQGVEFSSIFRATTNLQFGFNAAYIDAELNDDFQPSVGSDGPVVFVFTPGLGGDRMPFTPKFSAALTADYLFPLGSSGWEGRVGGGLRWVGSRVTGTSERTVISDTSTTPPTVLLSETVAPLELDNYHAVDLYAGISNPRWSIRAYLKNATDERAYSTLSRHDDAVLGGTRELVASPIQPRTFGLEFDYRF